jgi:hypothetical protein
VPFSAVIDMSNVVDRSEWHGKALVYLPKYVAARRSAVRRERRRYRGFVLGRSSACIPPSRARSARVSRLARARGLPDRDARVFARTLPPIATSVPGVFVLNSAHIVNGTLNVNETLGLVDRGLAALDACLPAVVQ